MVYSVFFDGCRAFILVVRRVGAVVVLFVGLFFSFSF